MAAPTITGIFPTSGPATGGPVTINGSGFTGATQVMFGSAAATGVSVISDGQINANSPAGTGTVSVSVTAPGGTSATSTSGQFTYVAASTGGPTSTTPPAGSTVTNPGYFNDPALSSQFVTSLLGIVQAAASPDVLEAQTIMLRRMALEGDIVGSRVPPPRNISEIGGYLNLLQTSKEPAMREQVMAGILGVAGPSNPQGWVLNTTRLAMANVTNDRPAGTGQASYPLTVQVRSDFVAAVQAAQKTIHSYGATLPLTGPAMLNLPAGTPGAVAPTASQVLLYLGRALMVAPSAALVNPPADPIVLFRVPVAAGATPNPWMLGANILSATTSVVPPVLSGGAPYTGYYETLQCSASASSVVDLPAPAAAGTTQATVPVLALGSILAAAGYYSASPIPAPSNSAQTSWAMLTNTTGLIAGVTQLGDELSLLYRADVIANSVFATMLTQVWNGTGFA